MLATGLLFDIKVAAIAFSVPLLAALVLAARPAAHALWLRCLPAWAQCWPPCSPPARW
ncbi:hypothetical protein WJ973_02460 [Achromobacter xylosoxidans]